jgi:hypothetical protein
MGWVLGIAAYAVLLAGVVLIAGGTRRGDLRHADAVKALAALDAPPCTYAELPRVRAAAGGEQRV